MAVEECGRERGRDAGRSWGRRKQSRIGAEGGGS